MKPEFKCGVRESFYEKPDREDAPDARYSGCKKDPAADCSAYLDIETTGLSPYNSSITVIGICLEKNGGNRVIQIVGDDITADAIEASLEGAGKIYTYNGSRFDLKFIEASMGLDVAQLCEHEDLMYRCWKKKLFGGLKSVERQLGISRRLEGMGGEDAVRLWYDHLGGDAEALRILLEYNREDVVNLIRLRNILESC